MLIDGPGTINQKRQIGIPAPVLKAAGLEPGDQVYFQAQEDPPGSIVMIPVEVVTRWLELGRRADGSGQVADAAADEPPTTER